MIWEIDPRPGTTSPAERWGGTSPCRSGTSTGHGTSRTPSPVPSTRLPPTAVRHDGAVGVNAAPPFWGELSADDQEAVRAVSRRRTYAVGAMLFVEGDEATSVIVVVSGLLKLTRTAMDGRHVLIELLGAGHLVGELGAVDEKVRSATATAIAPVDALVIPAGRFRALLADRGTIALTVLSTVTARLRESADRLLESATADTTARLCSRLLELSAGGRLLDGGGIEITSPLTQQELADWSGVSRDAVVLAFRRLRASGWVVTGRRRIRIVDIDSVRAAAG